MFVFEVVQTAAFSQTKWSIRGVTCGNEPQV